MLFLIASFQAASPIELAIAARLGLDFAPQRAPLLQSDLRALHVDVAKETPPARPLQLETEAAAWGAAYVLEGSALGGVALAQSLERALGKQTARSYLTLRGAHTASRWRWFLSALAAFEKRTTVSDRIDATSAASSVFDAYLSAFSGAFPVPPKPMDTEELVAVSMCLVGRH